MGRATRTVRVVTADETDDFLRVNRASFACRPEPGSPTGIDGDYKACVVYASGDEVDDGYERCVDFTSAGPDLVMTGASLGAVLLGGTDVSALVVSRRILDRRTGAATDADRLLQCTPKPAMLTSF